MKKRIYDAIVIGAGLCGTIAAHELSSAGLNVIIVEKGATQPSGQKSAQHIQQRCQAFSHANKDLFVCDREEPYELAPNSKFSWIRTSCVGGRSKVWSGHSYRLGPDDFKDKFPDGSPAWPITYNELAGFYSRVEKLIGVSGISGRIRDLPDGAYRKPPPLYPVEQSILTQFQEGACISGFRGTIARIAVGQSRVDRGYSVFDATSLLVAAQKRGEVSILENHFCCEVLFDGPSGRATGVRVIDGSKGEDTCISARLVFLCASTVPSIQILLSSKYAERSNFRTEGSWMPGQYLMDHPFMVGAEGTVESTPVTVDLRKRSPGLYLKKARRRSDTVAMSYGVQGGAVPDYSSLTDTERKKGVAEVSRWKIWFGGWGSGYPVKKNSVTLSRNLRNHLGVLQPAISFQWSEGEMRLKQNMKNEIGEMLERLRVDSISTFDSALEGGVCSHEMGGLRMGLDSRTSALNRFNQLHGSPNVFVTDGSCMPLSPCQNPSLTYMALTARACSKALELMKNGEI